MNFIGIDPSLISTAVVVNGNIINYCRESKVHLKNGMSKWFKSADSYCDYQFIKYRSFENYSDGELIKLMDYDSITDLIIKDITDKLDPMVETYVGIEGYNFGAQVGDLLDLVTFSTLLRKKLFDQITENITVYSPSGLKLESCKLTYKPIEVEKGVRKKRIEIHHRNKLGMPGGKFTKKDMCLAIIENESIDDPWFEYIKSIKGDLMDRRDIPKPHEDINDASLLYHAVRKKQLSQDNI